VKLLWVVLLLGVIGCGGSGPQVSEETIPAFIDDSLAILCSYTSSDEFCCLYFTETCIITGCVREEGFEIDDELCKGE
jgi:hypothetical protein